MMECAPPDKLHAIHTESIPADYLHQPYDRSNRNPLIPSTISRELKRFDNQLDRVNMSPRMTYHNNRAKKAEKCVSTHHRQEGREIEIRYKAVHALSFSHLEQLIFVQSRPVQF
jgi:hypothetical protein